MWSMQIEIVKASSCCLFCRSISKRFLIIQIIFYLFVDYDFRVTFFVSFRFLTLTSGSCYIHCINVEQHAHSVYWPGVPDGKHRLSL